MQSFQLIKPCLALAPYIRHYWILQDDSVTPVSERTLPIGCMQLVFHKGKQLLLSGESELQPQSFISGQSVGFSDVQSTGRIEMITVVFQPYAVKALFHIPSHLFHGQNVDTDAMEDVELSDLVKQVTDTSDNAVSIRLIEQFFLRRLYTLPGNPETLLCFKSSHRLHQPTPYRHVQHSVERQLGNAFHSKLHGTINRRRWSRLHLQREQFQQFNSYRLGNSLRTDTKGRLLDQCRFGHHIR